LPTGNNNNHKRQDTTKQRYHNFCPLQQSANYSQTSDPNNMKLGRQVDIWVPNIWIKNELNRTPFAYRNCSSPKTILCWNFSSPNWQNCSQIWNSTYPNSKLCIRIEVLKLRNEFTKFGANPSTFEPPTTSLKTELSDLRILDRFTYSSSSPLLTWLWCSSVVSHPLTAAAMFLPCFSCSHTHNHQGWLGFSSYTSLRRQLSRSMRTSINGWYVLDFLDWCWAPNTPLCGGTWTNIL
jgi:hypothetical protein